MQAICGRCGGPKTDLRGTCARCGHRPVGQALEVAWLLSTHNLAPADLEEAGERLRDGLPLRPSRVALRRARRALGADTSTDPGLTASQRLVLVSLSVLLTPAPGLMLAWHWWYERPRSALQALVIAAPISLALTVTFAWLAWSELFNAR